MNDSPLKTRGLISQDLLNNEDKLQDIDQYDIFAFMGLSNLGEKDKDKLLYDLTSLVWNEFLAEQLPHILTQAQLRTLTNKVESEEDLHSIIKYILTCAPNTVDLLADFTREAKVAYLRRYYESRIRDYEREFDISDDTEKNVVETKIERLRQAIDLLEKYEWEALITAVASLQT